MSGVSRRHLGTPATCLLGRSQPLFEAVEEREVTVTALIVSSSLRSTWAVIFASSTRLICAFGDVRSSVVRYGLPQNSMPRTTSRVSTSSRRVMEPLFMNVSDNMESNGSEAGHFSTSGSPPTRPFGSTWRWRAGQVKNYAIHTS